MRIALCVFGILLMAGVAPQIWCAVQGQVELEPTNFRDAILITKITVGGVEVQCGQNGPPGGRAYEPVTPFPANDNWPLAMEISIFNRTNKVIAAGRIDLSFLKSGIESGPAPIEMQGGNLYGTPDANRPGRWVYQDQLYFPGNRYNHWPVPRNKWTPGPGK
jgi:hypothetical protein